MSVYATISDLRSQLGGPVAPVISAAYAAKMLHPLPKAETVKREAFILRQCVKKRVLEFGASGPLHDGILQVASASLGVDRTAALGVVAFDLDDIAQTSLPAFDPDVIVCGEVLEHLSNPGWFLTRLKRQYQGIPVIISVPNAYSGVSAHWISKGTENVNADHCCWFSPKTLSVLLERAGFQVGALYWYGGDGPTSEGFIVCTE